MVWETAKAVDCRREAARRDEAGLWHGKGYAAAWAFSEDGVPAAAGVGAGTFLVPSTWIRRATPMKKVHGTRRLRRRKGKVWMRVGRRASLGVEWKARGGLMALMEAFVAC